MRLLSLLAVLLLAAGCDSGDDRVLDADFYVGTWTLTSISDANGDQTAALRLTLDDLTIEFEDDRSFTLNADFSDLTNNLGQADITTEGTYQARPEVPSLILNADGVAAPLTASASSDSQVTLSAPAAIVNVLLDGLPFQFEGTTAVAIQRR